VQVIGPNGALITTTFPETIRVAAPAVTKSALATVNTRSGEFRVRTTHFSNGAVASVGRSLDETHRVLRNVRNRTVLLIVLVAVLAAVAGAWIADLITGPLRRLTATADDVALSGRPHTALDGLPDTGPTADRGDEVGRLTAGFGRMLRALARSQSEQERLVQDAGHELRTPLTSLRTNLDTLRRYPDISAEQRAAIVDDLHAEVEELSALVDEIVAVAGGGLTADGAGELDTDFDLTDLAGTLAERYARRAGRPVTVDGPGVAVVAQRGAVQRAISCLLDNARKFDPSDVPIEVRVTAADGFARVVVADRGPGIPADQAERVFDRFHRSDEARTLPGSGLGLAIVRAVAERHGGTATAASREGGGAEVGFSIRLEPE